MCMCGGGWMVDCLTDVRVVDEVDAVVELNTT